MLFKNIHVYKLQTSVNDALSIFERGGILNDLNEKLESKAFSPCPLNQISSSGFCPIVDERFAYGVGDAFVFCLKTEEKIIPAAAVNEIVERKAAIIENAESRKLGRKERQSIKDDVFIELIPKALTKSLKTFGYICGTTVIINSLSTSKAEELISAIREALGSFPVIPLSFNNIPAQAMTSIVLSDNVILPEKFSVSNSAVLKDLLEQGSSVKLKECDIQNEETLSLLKNGMSVTELKLDYIDRLSFVIDETLRIRRIKFSDLVQESIDQDSDDAIAVFDSEFLVFKSEIDNLIKDLAVLFGGKK